MIRNLATHPARFVTIAELAEYWAVSRQQIHKRIESGVLEGIRLGARLYRVPTQAALEFERNAVIPPSMNGKSDSGPPVDFDRSRLPVKIGVRRLRVEAGNK